MSDITRMWPVNGRFSPEQRELYGFFPLDVEAVEKAMREPGILQRYPPDPEGLPLR
jgi:Xaa-Pro aminopeptidase